MDPYPFIHENILGNLMGCPKAAVDCYKSEDCPSAYYRLNPYSIR
jgi:hypothetical protein